MCLLVVYLFCPAAWLAVVNIHGIQGLFVLCLDRPCDTAGPIKQLLPSKKAIAPRPFETVHNTISK